MDFKRLNMMFIKCFPQFVAHGTCSVKKLLLVEFLASMHFKKKKKTGNSVKIRDMAGLE